MDGPDNGSYGGMLLEDKLMFYRKDTRLAGMPNPDFFRRGNIRLREFLRAQGLLPMVTTYDASTALEPFIDARGRFYYEVTKRIWSLDALGLAPPAAPGPAATGKRTRYGVRFKDLVPAGFIGTDDRLIGYRRNRMHYARIRPDGNIETASGFHRHRAHQGDGERGRRGLQRLGLLAGRANPRAARYGSATLP